MKQTHHKVGHQLGRNPPTPPVQVAIVEEPSDKDKSDADAGQSDDEVAHNKITLKCP